jgi:hypothetical protein
MTVAPVCLESIVIEVSSDAGAQTLKVNGIIQETAGKSLMLVTDAEIPASSRITMQSKDFIFLGEVLSCVPEHDAKWTTHVRVKRSLLIV